MLDPLLKDKQQKPVLHQILCILAVVAVILITSVSKLVPLVMEIPVGQDFEYYCEDTKEAPHIKCKSLTDGSAAVPPAVATGFLKFCAKWVQLDPANPDLDWEQLKDPVTAKLAITVVDATQFENQQAETDFNEHQQAFLTQNSDFLQSEFTTPKVVVVITGAAGVGKSTVVTPILSHVQKSRTEVKTVLIDGENFREAHQGLQQLFAELRKQSPRVTYKFQDLMKDQSKDFKGALWKAGLTSDVVMYPTVISKPPDDAKKLAGFQEKGYKIIFIECILKSAAAKENWLKGIQKRGRETGKPASEKDCDKYAERSSQFEKALEGDAKYKPLLEAWNQRYVLADRGTKLEQVGGSASMSAIAENPALMSELKAKTASQETPKDAASAPPPKKRANSEHA